MRTKLRHQFTQATEKKNFRICMINIPPPKKNNQIKIMEIKILGHKKLISGLENSIKELESNLIMEKTERRHSCKIQFKTTVKLKYNKDS